METYSIVSITPIRSLVFSSTIVAAAIEAEAKTVAGEFDLDEFDVDNSEGTAQRERRQVLAFESNLMT